MLSDKPWRLESAFILILGVLFGMVGGGLAGQALGPVVSEWASMDRTFFNFVLNMVSFHGVALFLLAIFLRQHGYSWAQFVGLTPTSWINALAWAVMVGLVMVPVALALNKICFHLIEAFSWTPEQQMPVRILQTNEGWQQRLCFGITAIVFAPIVEESLFRGVLYPLIKQRGYPRAAVWSTSLFFAVIHSNLMTFIPLTVVALILVWLYERTDMLLAPILAHAFFNLVNFLLLVYDDPITAWLEQVRRQVGY